MSITEIGGNYLEELGKTGVKKAQCVLTNSEKHILAFESDRVSTFRTSRAFDARILAISGGKGASLSASCIDAPGIARAAAEAAAAVAAAPIDPALDITAPGPARTFNNGVRGPDAEKMFMRVSEFVLEVKSRYPALKFQTAYLSYTRETKLITNSLGLSMEAKTGLYEMALIFCSSVGGGTSSFNHYVGCVKNLDVPLMAWEGVERLLRQSAELVEARPLAGKFKGDIVVSPECLWDFLSFIANSAIKDNKLLAGISPYNGRLGQRLAVSEFTLRSLPVSGRLASGYAVTKEGEVAEDVDIIKRGILKNYLLSGYAAAKIGLKRVANDGECFVVEPGNSRMEDMIGSIKKGLLVTRFSGANPNDKGDFSGIAKNSFYIEDGKIRFPVSETMISANIPEMLLNIMDISKERINSGYSVYPWISFSGINISGR